MATKKKAVTPAKKRKGAKAGRTRTVSVETVQTAEAAFATPKPVLVGAAVAMQLQMEFRWPPNDLGKVMGSDYHYKLDTIGNFLEAVRVRLTHAVPPLSFVPTGGFAAKALKMRVLEMVAAIDRQTT